MTRPLMLIIPWTGLFQPTTRAGGPNTGGYAAIVPAGQTGLSVPGPGYVGSGLPLKSAPESFLPMKGEVPALTYQVSSLVLDVLLAPKKLLVWFGNVAPVL